MKDEIRGAWECGVQEIMLECGGEVVRMRGRRDEVRGGDGLNGRAGWAREIHVVCTANMSVGGGCSELCGEGAYGTGRKVERMVDKEFSMERKADA